MFLSAIKIISYSVYSYKNISHTPEERRKARFLNKSSATAIKYLRKIEDLPHKPDTLKPFTDVLKHVFVDMQGAVKPMGVPSVGTYCVMVPPELIYAAGAMPVKLCGGSYTAFNVGDDIAPRDACPLIKAIMGFESIGVMPVYQECQLMAVPITCDCKKKLAGYLAEHRKTVTLHVPSGRDRDEDMEQYVRELYLFSQKLTEVTGIELSYERLSWACGMTAAAQYELSRFIELRRRYPLAVKGTHYMAAMNAISYTHISLWTQYMHDLCDETEQKAKRGEMASKENRPRILITGSPIVFPNFKLPLLIEEMGGALVADETCMGERGAYDPPAIVDQSTDGIMRALANKSTRPCTCPTFVDNKRRLYRIMQMLEDYRVQGVIYHVLRGCLVYDYEYQVMEEELGKLGIPIIRVESDYNEEDVEQLRIRVEAFIELIKYGRRGDN
ncbi:2-hydroxyacyl-CoA dehydratase family protein [uncultured Ruminococcus sp.]|uniref:2-hydroxyacyl-CoA dehydratase family protein n=1 Tax=uncultured Ruminococcus sp. TaxID=165186 RepID=UPI00292FC3E7|nr:2-hydroxyacyl-CoA dehydratase family protein [uncultured Ruminococcus sp.]